MRVMVDFLTESMGNGAIGLLVNDLCYISREDGSFDDGDQTPMFSSPSSREYLADFSTQVTVKFDQGVTTIKFDISTLVQGQALGTDLIEIIHVYGIYNVHATDLVNIV